jgi:hypothetical protein
MPISTFKRYEMKFLLNKKQYEALVPELIACMNPDKYCQNGKNYTIYNIYYDTPDNHIIRTSLSKPYYKEKLRLRSYTSPCSMDDKVFLELKKKTGGIVHKRRATMTLREAYDFIESGKYPPTSNYINEQVVNEISYFLSKNKVVPAAYISYSRMAFFGKTDKNFRITFDNDIRTRRDNLYLDKGSSGEQLLQNDQYLMEVKISGSVPMWLAAILSELKIYKTSFSKYGMEYQKYCLTKEASETSIAFSPNIILLNPRLCINY